MRCSLNSDRLRATTVSLGSPFQWPAALSVKNLFFMSYLNFPWCSFIPPIAGHQREISTSSSIAPLEEAEDCREATPQPSPGWTKQVTSAAPHKSCPQDFSSSWSPSSGHTLIVWYSCTNAPTTAHRTQAGAVARLLPRWVGYAVIDTPQDTAGPVGSQISFCGQLPRLLSPCLCT